MPTKGKKYIGRVTCLSKESKIFKSNKYKHSISTFIYIVSAKNKKQADKTIKKRFEETFTEKIEEDQLKVLIYNVNLLRHQSGIVHFSFDSFLTDSQHKQIEKINWLS